MVKTSSGVVIRPRGLIAESFAGRAGTVGGFLADMTSWRRQSFRAWARFTRELRAHGAPRDLIDRMVTMVSDQMRHAEGLSEASARFADVFADWEETSARSSSQAMVEGENVVRSVFELAVANAVHGTVRETFAALEAGHQATHAEDGRLRVLFRAIADDALLHAALFRDVAMWLEASLDASDRSELAAAKEKATFELALAISREPSSELIQVAGLPSATCARELFGDWEEERWVKAA